MPNQFNAFSLKFSFPFLKQFLTGQSIGLFILSAEPFWRKRLQNCLHGHKMTDFYPTRSHMAMRSPILLKRSHEMLIIEIYLKELYRKAMAKTRCPSNPALVRQKAEAAAETL